MNRYLVILAVLASFAAGFWLDRWLHRPIIVHIALPHVAQQYTREVI